MDITNFRLPDDDPRCHYVFVVITSVPQFAFNYDITLWGRIKSWFGFGPVYVYFHIGQIIICDTDETGASPRETPWGAKPGKHDCTVETFTDLAEAIEFAKSVVNDSIGGGI